MKTNSRLIEALETRIAPAFAASASLAGLIGSNGFHIDGVAAGDLAGTSIAEAGDINGDGFGDIIIGAPGAAGGKGEAYVVFGKESGFSADLDLAALTPTQGFKMTGVNAGDKLGTAVAGAGDFNGDGFDDLLVGAPGTGSAHAYLVFGKSSSFGSSFDLSTLKGDGVGGASIVGFAGDNLGSSVAGIGDFNGDGLDDIAIGASKSAPGNKTEAGRTYVLFGRTAAGFDPNAPVLLAPQFSVGGSGFEVHGASAGDHAGTSVAAAGDVNGDGLADLIVGAPDATALGNTGSGRAYVLFGQSAPPPQTVQLSGLVAGSTGFRINGAGAGDGAGFAVSGAGDVNGDGFADLIVGSKDPTPGAQTGEGYLVYGKSSFLAEKNLSSPDLLFTSSVVGEKVATSVSALGDFNGDGYDDLLVSGPGGKNGAVDDAGHSYVVFGSKVGIQSGGTPGQLNLSALDGKNGFALTGVIADDGDGQVVSGAGDVNGDGFADLLVGQASVDSNGHTDAGRAFVVFGSNGGNKVTVSADGKTATYTDVDGDLVTIKSSVGKLTADLFKLSGANELGGSTLEQIDLAGNTAFAKANFTISAKPQLSGGTFHGDGLANIGAFDADGVNLGKVVIKGDVGHFDASSVKSLTVNSLGGAGLTTQRGGDASLTSVIGSLPQLTVKTNVDHAFLASAKIGTIKIGGDLRDSKVSAAQSLKTLFVGGDLTGSQVLGGYSLGVNADAQIGKIFVKGDWRGSTAVAGIQAGQDGFYGTADDVLASGGKADIHSRIASIVIGGQAIGSFSPGGHFAIEAEQIGSVKIGTTKLPLSTSSTPDDFFLGPTGDFRLHEIA